MELDLSLVLDFDNITVKDLDLFKDIVQYVKYGSSSQNKYVYSENCNNNQNKYTKDIDNYEMDNSKAYNVGFSNQSTFDFTRWAA